MGNMNFGFTALMEAMQQTEKAEQQSVSLFETMEDIVDDDVIAMVGGDEFTSMSDDDDIEADIAGLGIDDEEKDMEKLLAMIPEDDEGMDDDIESLVESCIPEYGELV